MIKRLKFRDKGLKRGHGKGHDLRGCPSSLGMILGVTLMLSEERQLVSRPPSSSRIVCIA